jgi:hypothetical protein
VTVAESSCASDCFSNAGVAQLVERNLAKVEVTSSSLVTRSSFEKGSPGFPFYRNSELFEFAVFVKAAPTALTWVYGGAIAKRLCPGLQIRLVRFDSGSRLQK